MQLAVRLPGRAGIVLRLASCSGDAAESPAPDLRCSVRVAALQVGRTLCELIG